jgi:SAM-dependent methyltransferase
VGDHAGGDSAREASLRALQSNPVWYHTLQLPGGVVTPGQIDLRAVASKLLPSDLTGKRALDVGTFDGFWAFEMERRGAEVVAIDLAAIEDAELPPGSRAGVEREAKEFQVELGRGFALAAELLSARAKRVACNVLDLDTAVIGGAVDIAFMGALLVHLRDPVAALERIRGVLVPGGELYQLEAISVWLSVVHPRRPVADLQTLRTAFNWWYPNRSLIRAWLGTAGFTDIRTRGIHRPPQRRPMNDTYLGIVSRRPGP